MSRPYSRAASVTPAPSTALCVGLVLSGVFVCCNLIIIRLVFLEIAPLTSLSLVALLLFLLPFSLFPFSASHHACMFSTVHPHLCTGCCRPRPRTTPPRPPGWVRVCNPPPRQSMPCWRRNHHRHRRRRPYFYNSSCLRHFRTLHPSRSLPRRYRSKVASVSPMRILRLHSHFNRLYATKNRTAVTILASLLPSPLFLLLPLLRRLM